LEANIDPMDVRSHAKRAKILEEIEMRRERWRLNM
jgi:hypothetical protein